MARLGSAIGIPLHATTCRAISWQLTALATIFRRLTAAASSTSYHYGKRHSASQQVSRQISRFTTRYDNIHGNTRGTSPWPNTRQGSGKGPRSGAAKNFWRVPRPAPPLIPRQATSRGQACGKTRGKTRSKTRGKAHGKARARPVVFAMVCHVKVSYCASL